LNPAASLYLRSRASMMRGFVVQGFVVHGVADTGHGQ